MRTCTPGWVPVFSPFGMVKPTDYPERRCKFKFVIWTRQLIGAYFMPSVKGGTNDLCNLVLGCKYCNSDKGVLPWRSWFQDQDFYCPDRARALWRGSQYVSDGRWYQNTEYNGTCP